MSSNAEEDTIPPEKAAKKWAQGAAKKADPWADRALYAIQGSEWSAVWIVVIVIALIGFGLWLRG